MVAGEESDLYASHFLLAFDIVVDSILIVCYHKREIKYPLIYYPKNDRI